MLPVWKTEEPDFHDRFSALLSRLSLGEGLRAPGTDEEVTPQKAVRRIVDDVHARGDAALLEYTRTFDGCTLEASHLRVSDEAVEQAVARCPAALLDAMKLAAGRIEAFQRSIMVAAPAPLEHDGCTLSIRYCPVDSAAIYVPGGSASLASSVLMAAVPARVAGVRRLAMATPPSPDGTVSDDRLAAANVADVDVVYRMGGAQAIAALAYGTESVERTDFIAGPGSIYVTLAKKEVFGQVGIEMLPGPSEVVVVADETASAGNVAADMLAQAEHAPGSAVLLTDSQALAEDVCRELEQQSKALSQGADVRSCLEAYGAVIVCRSMDECVELTNELAPEHLEVIAADAEGVAARVRHAGAIFVGPWTPVAVGDYVAGPSHVLPTATTARFSSGLSVNDFLKRTSIVRYGRSALEGDAAAIRLLAGSEGLDAHAASVDRRLRRPD